MMKVSVRHWEPLPDNLPHALIPEDGSVVEITEKQIVGLADLVDIMIYKDYRDCDLVMCFDRQGGRFQPRCPR